MGVPRPRPNPPRPPGPPGAAGAGVGAGAAGVSYSSDITKIRLVLLSSVRVRAPFMVLTICSTAKLVGLFSLMTVSVPSPCESNASMVLGLNTAPSVAGPMGRVSRILPSSALRITMVCGLRQAAKRRGGKVPGLRTADAGLRCGDPQAAAASWRLLRAGNLLSCAGCAWGFVALGGALLVRVRDYSWRCLAQFTALVAIACVPVAGMAWRYAAPGTQEEWQASNRLAVLFSDPMHLDPTYFGGWQEFVLLCVLAALAGWAFFRVTERRRALLLCYFLAVLLLVFLTGLLAWETKQFWFLKSFPFRVPDTLIYLFLMLAFPSFYARLLTRMGIQIKEDRLKPRTRQTWMRLALFSSLALLAAAGMLFEIQSVAREDLPVFAGAWREYLQGQITPWQEMTKWIRENTPKRAIVMAPPWEFSFWIDAERAQVVSYKRPPHNARLLEWHRRMTEMNGEPFHTRGEWILDELNNIIQS